MPSPSTRGTSRRTPRRPPADLDDNTVNDTMSPASPSNNPRYTCNESDLPVFLPQLHKYITASNPKYIALQKVYIADSGTHVVDHVPSASLELIDVAALRFATQPRQPAFPPKAWVHNGYESETKLGLHLAVSANAFMWTLQCELIGLLMQMVL